MADDLVLPLFDTPDVPLQPTGIRLTQIGPPAREVLWDLISEAKGADALAPVTVAVPSPYAGLSLRRELGARRGLVNVRFMALARVAELLGAPALAATGRRPLAGPLRDEAVHAALAADPGPFAAVAEHPSTTTRLAATFHDLRRAGSDLAGLAGRGARAEAVARLYADFRDRTRDFYDEDDLFLAATDAVERGGSAPDDVGQVIVWLPTALAPSEEAFVRALAQTGRASVVLGLTGDDRVDSPQSRALGTRLGGPAPDPPPSSAQEPAGERGPLGTRVIAAPDPEDEVRAVVRRVVAHAAAGEPLNEIAILHRIDEPYARLVPEILHAAGVPWNGPSPRRLADGVAGRMLLALLRLADADLARDEVAAWLASGPVRDADGRRVPATRWDVMSREAGVVVGADQWAERLTHHRADLVQELADARADDTKAWRTRRIESDLETIDALSAFTAEVAERLVPPTEPTWAAHAVWAQSLADRYLGSIAKRADWPDEEIEAGERVATVLDGLAALDSLGAHVNLARFRRALAGQLDVPFGRVAQFGTGVFVGPMRSAYGTRFATIFVLGMAEGSFPPRGSEDPLLPDRDRRVVGDLPLHADRWSDERRDYLATLAAASERVLCFPRADPRAQRKRLPARWLLETAGRLAHNDELGAEDFLMLGAQPWFDVVRSFADGITNDDTPASETEYDIRSLAAWRAASRPLREHPLATGTLGAGFAALEARATNRLTPFEGGIGTGHGLAITADRSISPTALQDWAACPFRYFLARGLRVREVPKPEATDTISALDEGTLVHAILETFVTQARQLRSPDEAWDANDVATLMELAESECNEAERRGITGRPLRWKLARRRILRTIRNFALADAVARATHQVLPEPEGVEMQFGDADTPVSITLPGGRTVSFRGRIDRVDLSSDRRTAVVYDYKTGKVPKVGDDPVAAGRKLQLQVYALAARARWDKVESARAFYWSTRAEPEDALVEVPVDAQAHARFSEVVETIVEGIDAGAFVAFPGDVKWDHRTRRDTHDNCMWCPYDRVCPPDRLGAWDRNSSDPAVASFIALAPDEEDET